MKNEQRYQPLENSILVEVIEVKDDYLVCAYEDSLHHEEACAECDDNKWEEEFLDEADCRKANDCTSSSEVTIEVFKPLNLQVSPWDGKSITYNAGEEGEVQITYTYVNSQKRKSKYSVATDRCEMGEHIETVWPPYRARVGTPQGNNEDASEDYVKGDVLRVQKNVYKKQDLNDRDAATQAQKRSQFTIDLNIDGRTWSDDCGSKQLGGSVWV